ncbi:MAG TPA: BTAD domain-containing putative transcriptional regulator [Solirubrobacterales bacterium]|nr:BTAD domain-containing putative transcriptional regulator [Solirubrobacterales bacterium]
MSVGPPQQRAVLALLLLNANEVVSRDRIIDELWGADPPATAAKLVQLYVSRLRKAIASDPAAAGDVVVTRTPGYLLQVDPDQLDLDRFERLVAEGRRALREGRHREADERLREALALWRGPPLADFTFELFAEVEIGRLEELRLEALEDRIEADLALGRGDLVGELESLIARHPLREKLRGQLMLALYRSGRQSEALEAYRDTRGTLVDEVGVEPGPDLRRLERAILAQDPALDHRDVTEAASERSTIAFVGRDREFAELARALADAEAGRGRLVMLVGEPGIGKSRLADELIESARARGVRVAVGRCWEAGGAPAYWPWVQSLRSYVGEIEPEALRVELADEAAALAQLLPELRDTVAAVSPPPPETEGARFRMFEAVSAFLRRSTRAHPLVLVLDDLHAADEPSLLLLRFVASELAGSRIVVVCAFRDVAPTLRDPLVSTVAELVRDRGVTQISLGGLSLPDVARYIELSTGVEPARRLVEAVYAETEGNPLFVAETVRLLEAEGRIADPDADRRIPPGVRAAIDQRLRRVSERCRHLLTLASVLGREFALAPLARLGELGRGELLESLDEALVERILEQVPGSPSRLRFAHALIRDTLYEELPPVRRMQHHRGAAEALAETYSSELGPHLTELAHHYVAAAPAGVAGEAVEFARRAGDRAASQLAYEEASRLYSMALPLADGPGLRCDLLLALGDSRARAGDSPAAKQAFRDAAELAGEHGLRERLARAALGYGGRIIWERQQDDEQLVPLLERALEAIGDEDSALRVRLLSRLAGGPLRSTRFPPERRFRLSREALEIARRLGDPATLAYALDAHIPAIESPANTLETLTLSTELLEMATTAGDKERVLEAHEHRHERFFELGEIEKAGAELEAMASLAAELRQPSQRWLVVVCRARLALHEGRFEAAEKLIEEARELGEQALSWNAGVAFAVQSYMLRREQGRPEEALAVIRRSAVEYPDYELWQCALAAAAADLSHQGEAEQAFEALAAEGFAGLPFDQNAWLVGVGLLAETAGSLADSGHASSLYELLLPYAERVAVIYPELSIGSVSRYLGILAATMRRGVDAERHFEGGLEANERIGARPWLAHTQEDYARLLAARGSRGDRERAGDLAASALEGYRSLRMDRFAAAVANLARALGRH